MSKFDAASSLVMRAWDLFIEKRIPRSGADIQTVSQRIVLRAAFAAEMKPLVPDGTPALLYEASDGKSGALEWIEMTSRGRIRRRVDPMAKKTLVSASTPCYIQQAS